MKKVFFLLVSALLFVLPGFAEDFTPQTGKPYLIQCALNSKQNFAQHNPASVKDDKCILSVSAQYDESSFFVIEGNATDGFTIRSNKDNTYYVYAINTNGASGAGGDSNVGVKQIEDAAEVDATCKWKIQKNNLGYWNIIPKNGASGWNQRGSENNHDHIGQWTSNNSLDNSWRIMTPTEFVQTTAQLSSEDANAVSAAESETIGHPLKDGAAKAKTAYEMATALEASVTAESKAAFETARAAAVNAGVKLYLPTGYYKIQCVDTQRPSWIYNNPAQEGNTKQLTLQSSEEKSDITARWSVTNKGTYITIACADGSPLTTGAGDGDASTPFGTLTFGAYKGSKSGIYFTEAINCTNGSQAIYQVGGVNHLTTWVDGGADQDDNRWTFTAVSEEVYPQLMGALIDKVNNNMGKVGYFNEAGTTAINAALSTAESQKENATAEQYNTFKTAVTTAFNTAANVQMPEAGKVYVIANLMPEGTKRYLYVNESGLLRWQLDRPTANRGYFLVQQHGEGLHKISALCGEGNLSSGSTNFNTETTDFTSDEGNDVTLTVQGMQLGSVSIIVDNKSNAANNPYRLFCTAQNTAQTLGYSSVASVSACVSARKCSYSAANTYTTSDFTFEEVSDYTPFASTLAKGSNGCFGTLCLPYAVMLPEGVTAHSVVASADGNTLWAVPQTLNDGVLPAGSPVILTAESEGSKSFQPATAQGEKLETALTGSIAPKTITGNAYVLARGGEEETDAIGFFLYDTTTGALPGNKAYYVPAAGSAPQMFNLSLGESTGLEGVMPSEAVRAQMPMYDLSGRRITAPAPGTLYLQGGRKYIKQ